jgi:hypothetical protein
VLTIAGITRIDGEKLQQAFALQGLHGSLLLSDLEADFQLMEGA